MESEKEVGMEETEKIVEEPEQTETPAPEPTEEELAAEALGITEEAEEKPEEELVPATVVAVQRAARRAAELEAAELRGRLEAQKTQEVPEKAPLELAAEEQGVPVDEVVIDGKLYKQQQEWDKKQAESKSQQTQLENFKKAATHAQATMTDEVHGKGLGLQSLQELGRHLLDDLDQQRIYRAGNNCGKEAMKLLKLRILEAGGENAKELRKRLQSHKTQTKPKKETKVKSEQKKEEPEQEIEEESDAYLESIFEGL